jgi:hypothetical protein
MDRTAEMKLKHQMGIFWLYGKTCVRNVQSMAFCPIFPKESSTSWAFAVRETSEPSFGQANVAREIPKQKYCQCFLKPKFKKLSVGAFDKLGWA